MIVTVRNATLANTNDQIMNWITEEAADSNTDVENETENPSNDNSNRDNSIPEFPGNDPAKSPGDGWEWRGKGEPSTGKGSWYNPKTGETLHPDLNHQPPLGPHWDWSYKGSGTEGWRIYPDGNITPS